MRKQKKSKRPLMRSTHLPMILLGAVMTLFGLVSALVWSISSNQAMRGLITWDNSGSAWQASSPPAG